MRHAVSLLNPAKLYQVSVTKHSTHALSESTTRMAVSFCLQTFLNASYYNSNKITIKNDK